MIERSALVDCVMDAAKFRGDPEIPRDYITEVLERVEKGAVKVERYPNGSPRPKQVYEIASRLFLEDQRKPK